MRDPIASADDRAAPVASEADLDTSVISPAGYLDRATADIGNARTSKAKPLGLIKRCFSRALTPAATEIPIRSPVAIIVPVVFPIPVAISNAAAVLTELKWFLEG